MKIRPFHMAFVLASVHAIAQAQVYKCKGEGNRYVFQDTPCPSDVSSQDRKRPKVGEKDENFVRMNNARKPGANWEPRTRIAQESQTDLQLPSPGPAATPPYAAAKEPPKEREREFQSRRALREEEERKAYNEQVEAHNKMLRCNFARQQLGVAKEERPIFTRDNNGDRHYVNDENRQGVISAAEKRVAAECG